MNESTKTKKALRGSLFALFLCIVLLIGTTFAWFTDTASTGVNKIQSGNLDVQLLYSTDGTTWNNAEGKTLKFLQKQADETVAEGENILWEPGCTYKLPQIKVVNNGNLALKYTMKVTGVEGDQKLNEVIDWTIDGKALTDFDDSLTAGQPSNAMTIQGHMQESAGNEYQGLSIDGISITVYATQDTVESDSFNNQYDKDARVDANSVAAISDAMKKAGSVINVNESVAPERTLIAEKKDITLNMNGKTIANTSDIWDVAPNNWSLVSAQNGSSLTIDGNGTFKAKANDCYAVDVQDGSTVVIKNGTFVGNIHAVYVYEGTAIIEGGTYSVQQKYPDAAKADEFVLNCYDANRANGTAKIIVKGGTFINFNPADCQAEGKDTNFLASGYTVKSEVKGNDTYYTVVKAN
ncbi:SipW-cognate class signal peptide [uncultured Eubacterium sp.]|uniref:SipW-dependent-type signal peptide-containing protein n=1 Tax=Brotomerdimonas butyrica TaxID=2981721 RepID=UPI0008206943|nr:SipW-dependent-type signal peptide-containing protein [Brotomerdimonas butyrica]MCU6754996.1 SipW-dependent-type signal peptide-containing protein [Brotomerdimonas butyrica]SCH06615.1 SipW-cognate class signal peptide [uncultured Eubacterium sp.]